VLCAGCRIDSGVAAVVTGRARRAVAARCGINSNQHSSKCTTGRIPHSSAVTKTALRTHSSCHHVEWTKEHCGTEKSNQLFSVGKYCPVFGCLAFALQSPNSCTCQKVDQNWTHITLKSKREQKIWNGPRTAFGVVMQRLHGGTMSHRNFRCVPAVSFPANIDANAVSDSREAPFAAQTWQQTNATKA
jgi:hypothetical protein